MEGVTKWDYGYSESFIDAAAYKQSEPPSLVSTAQKCMNEDGFSRTRFKHYKKKLDEEEFKSLKDDVRRARKDCKKMQVLYTELMADISEIKSSARKFMHDYVREKKTLEDLCIEQAKEVEANKGQIKKLRIECDRIKEEMNEERKMLQMAEALREDRAQMKLFDAKWILEDKYSEMSNFIADVKALLGSFDSSTKDENQMIDPRNIQRIQQVLSSIPKSDEVFTNMSTDADNGGAMIKK